MLWNMMFYKVERVHCPYRAMFYMVERIHGSYRATFYKVERVQCPYRAMFYEVERVHCPTEPCSIRVTYLFSCNYLFCFTTLSKRSVISSWKKLIVLKTSQISKPISLITKPIQGMFVLIWSPRIHLSTCVLFCYNTS